jgi:hypothetical protein
MKGCSLVTLLESLQAHFSLEPPVYSKPKEGPSAPQSLSADKNHPDVLSRISTISPSHPSPGSPADRPALPSKPPSMIPPGPQTKPVCSSFRSVRSTYLWHHSSIVTSFAAVCTASVSSVRADYKCPLFKLFFHQPCPGIYFSALGNSSLPSRPTSYHSSTFTSSSADPTGCTATTFSSAANSAAPAIPR